MELLDKLKASCPCLEGMSSDQFWPKWRAFVRFLSNITCWDVAGGTIERCQRQHSVTLPLRLCDYDCIQVQPYYKCIDLDTVAVEIRQYTAFGVNVIPIDNRYFNYDDISDRFYVSLRGQLDVQDEPCDPTCRDNVLVFSYVAGYDLEDENWFELICHYMTAYVAVTNDCMTLNDCASVHRLAIGAKLVRKTIDTINYEWEIDDNSKELFFSHLIQNFYTNLLGNYALCGREYVPASSIYIGKDGSSYAGKV